MTDILRAIENLEVPEAPEVFCDLGEHEEAMLAAYTDEWNQDRQTWGEFAQENLDRLERGSFSLHWMNTEGSNWGTKVKPSSRGLTLEDINRPKCYGTVPDRAAYRNMAPRGAVRDPYADRLPDIPEFALMDKWDVWSDNVCTLYEEAKVRQWNATKDVPWTDLEPATEELEKAACQFATFLTELEFVAGDFPAKWLYRIPNDFYEIKGFLATQIMDESRHMEVFRKRALAGGGGLLHVTPIFEWLAKSLLASPTHTLGGFYLNLLGEGFILSLFRAGEFLAKTQVDREIFRLCLQDEARHVAFGTIEMKNYLENHPEPQGAYDRLQRFADLAETLAMSVLTEPTVYEPLAILMGGGVDNIDEGMEGVMFLWGVIVDEYLQRCDRAGFDRRERCKFHPTFPWKVAQ